MTTKDITQVDNTYIIDKKDNYLKKDTEIGDIKQKDDFFPQAKFKYWDNEVNFSIRYKCDIKDSFNIIKDNKVNWKSKDKKREVNLYEIDGYEEGGFEIEVVLNEKLDSNKIEYTLQTKGLDFFYQPEISDEQAKELLSKLKSYDSTSYINTTLIEAKRMIRPENVVGSYAVYHSTKKNNMVDKKGNLIGNQYKTGKVFHIYRPEAIDNKGNKIWCDLNIDEKNNLLTIEVPQEFLDKAIYPVIVDPTFGDTSTGSSTENVSGDDVLGCKFSLSEGATCQSLSAYIGGGYSYGDRKIKGVIWNDDSGKTIVTDGVGGESSTYSNNTSRWYTSTFGTDPELTADDYYIGVAVYHAWGAYIGCKYDSGSQSWTEDTSNSYSSPQALGTSVTGTTRTYSIYVTYTVYSGPTLITKKLHYYTSGSNSNITADNFNDNSLATFWTNTDDSGNGGSSTLNEQNTRLEMTGTSNSNQYGFGVRYASQDSVSGNFDITIKLVENSVTDDSDNYMECGISSASSIGNNDNYISIGITQQGTATIYSNMGGTEVSTASYSSGAIWFKISYTGTTLKHYYSTNGTSWTLYQTGTGISAADVRYISLFLAVGSYSTTNITGHCYFDDFTNNTIGGIVDISLYSNTTGMTNTLPVYIDGAKAYAHARTAANPGTKGTDLKIRKGGATYTIASAYGTE